MSLSLTEERAGSVPITPIRRDTLNAWIEAHPQHKRWLEATAFKAEPGSFALLPNEAGELARVLAAPNKGAAVWAFAGLPTSLPEGVYAFDTALTREQAGDTALGWALGAYAFTRYKAPKRAPAQLVWPDDCNRQGVERLARAITLARDLINTPAEDMGPSELIAAGESVAAQHGAQVRVVRGDDLLRENYPAIHAVGRAAAREPALLDLRWGDTRAPRVTLVGKGVCFDTGGLNIKPHDGMLEMKRDMGGAAIMLALAQTLMESGLLIRLRVLIPTVENSISGNALRPRDIIRTRKGTTVEVGNTDAEGRLILCDALAEADSESPELLIDCATLTGAAKIALGPEVQALYCDDDAIARSLQEISMRIGDPLWRMPLWRPYRKLIDGKCADMNNVAAGPQGGSIIAALYLSEFVSSAEAWVHLDIMAGNVTARPGRPEGGEATGLRALYTLIHERFG